MARGTRDLIESTGELRAALLAYKKACEAMFRAVEPGQPAISTLETMECLKIREHREAVTEAMAEFEAARHRVRLELVTAAQDEGRNLSDVARALGVSRQLTSRLGIEAKGKKREGEQRLTASGSSSGGQRAESRCAPADGRTRHPGVLSAARSTAPGSLRATTQPPKPAPVSRAP